MTEIEIKALDRREYNIDYDAFIERRKKAEGKPYYVTPRLICELAGATHISVPLEDSGTAAGYDLDSDNLPPDLTQFLDANLYNGGVRIAFDDETAFLLDRKNKLRIAANMLAATFNSLINAVDTLNKDISGKVNRCRHCNCLPTVTFTENTLYGRSAVIHCACGKDEPIEDKDLKGDMFAFVLAVRKWNEQNPTEASK